MTQRSSSRDWTWAVMLWAFLGACIWTGCGNDDPQYEVELPNGYLLQDWSWGDITISDSNGTSIGEHYFKVNQLNIVGEIIQGNYLYADDSDIAVQEYFIVNTANDEYQWFIKESDWRVALKGVGIDTVRLYWPRDFKGKRPFINRLIVPGALVFILGCVLLIIRGIARNERQARRQKWEQL